ncbi:Response regulator [Sulfidibacter corallicola]|uniref:Response regulator n=1 Tax=Sulfidibacter corallicola TaxID=2818388 RepID=A0A8A4TS74_SULCO|nr:response regulator [Sulfidibacter corallicola]QTD51888.1 response regulator [Sulfidibacter corallicola]
MQNTKVAEEKLYMSEDEDNRRILIVDDNAAIHEDFTKILPSQPEELDSFDDLEKGLFGDMEDAEFTQPTPDPAYYELTHAYQGEEAYKLVEKAEGDDKPFALIFMDVRMPPGWDGIETIKRIWEKWPHIEMVICTAYSDYSWEKILQKVGTTDQLMFLRKPFDVISVKQMALALTKKWNLGRKARRYVEDLERAVADRTRELNQKVEELQKAMDEIQVLQGILPMCMYCNKIRDDDNYWQRVDEYLQGHTVANVSHSVCPQCYESAMSSMLKEIQEEDDED